MKGGTTRRLPYSLPIPDGRQPTTLEAVLSYALVPQPDPELWERYMKTLPSEADREAARGIIREYAEPRLLTFRSKTLSR